MTEAQIIAAHSRKYTFAYSEDFMWFFDRLGEATYTTLVWLWWVITEIAEGIGKLLGVISARFPKIAGVLFVTHCLVTVGLVFLFILSQEQKWPTGLSEFDLISAEYFTGSGCNPECQLKIRASRVDHVPVEQTEVKYVLSRIQKEYSTPVWQNRLTTCLSHWEDFEWAQRYTMYPAEFIAGFAYVEGAGCQNIKSTNGDGGHGPMQVTSKPTTKQLQNLKKMLHLSDAEVDWRNDYRQNLIMGLIMFSYFENEFVSRGPGILAYNTGAGGTRRLMRATGFKTFTKRQISEFRGSIPDHKDSGARPRIYVDRILAGAVLMDKAHRELPTTGITSLTLADIPGADPKKDSMP